MSLINKMLRDLDARRGGEGERAALSAAVTPLAARREPSRLLPFLAIGGLAIATVLGGVAWYGTQVGNQEIPRALAVAAAPPAPKTPAAPMPPAPAPSPATPGSQISVPGVAPVPVDPLGGTPSASVASVAVTSLRLDDALLAAPPPIAEPSRKEEAVVPKAAERTGTHTVSSKTAGTTTAKSPPARPEAQIEKQLRLPSATERAETEYRRGLLIQRQGNPEEAAGIYRAALADYPEHAAARQSLAGLLIEAKRFDEAEDLLRKGTELAPVRLASTLALARLKVERNQVPAALELLQKNAASGERSAEYQGFSGALLNRAGRATEAVEHYQAATRLAPGEGRWWAGLGIALDAAGRATEARDAYQRARTLPGLPADLARHIEQRLR